MTEETENEGLRLSRVSLSVGQRALISNLTLSIRQGKVMTLMGASGSGKSSLVSFICGALDPAIDRSGAAFLNGVDVSFLPIEKRRIGVLFQDDLLFSHMNVGENLAFAVPKGSPRAARAERVAAALEEAELSGFAQRDPATLSGGQRARVALMRAMLAEPKALLLDEPFSRLDADLRSRVRSFTFDVVARRNIPALLVTHDEADVPGEVVRL